MIFRAGMSIGARFSMVSRVFAGWDGWESAEAELGEVLPREVVDQLGGAFRDAVEWHDGQTRPAGEPYWQHLLQVLQVLVCEIGVKDLDLLRAGLLHDVVEDTDGTRADLTSRFGERTAELVDAVTIPEVRDDQTKDEVRTAYLTKLAAAPEDVLLLKLSDRYSNVQRLHTHPRVPKQRSYYAETVERFVPLAVVNEKLNSLFADWTDAYSYLRGPVDTFEAADRLAAALHREQVDKSGQPYVRHVRAVAGIARANGASGTQQIAALLHDSVEDTPCTLEHLRDLGVPEQVVQLVDALSHRAGEPQDAYLARVAASPDAVLIKRADVEHNSSQARLGELDTATQERLRQKYARALNALNRGTER
ncbi:HD domain-containing protein [Kribbella sp. NPDC051952]|uniref:HD domain-containing protein n=1 Tax=Kribbella sp. NPDC051952 TaxID=3154851 RepID=UPI0034349F19